MRYTFLLLLLIVFTGCSHKAAPKQDALMSIQIVDRNGFDETITNQDRLNLYKNLDFSDNQPYRQVTRIYKKDGKGASHSAITRYHDNGELAESIECVGGRALGEYSSYFSNGKIKLKAQVVDGLGSLTDEAKLAWLFDGIAEAWNEEGERLASIAYNKGVLHGPSLYYYPSGSLAKEVPFFENRMHGTMVAYQENGDVLAQTPYVFGKREGKAFSKGNLGHPPFEETYKKDQLMQATYFDFSGQVVSSIDNGCGVKVVFEDGSLSAKFEYQQGLQEGFAQLFDQQGRLVSEHQVHAGMKEGKETIYYQDGTPKLSMEWHENMLCGKVHTWYENGKLESEKTFVDNKKHGPYFAWYETGELMCSEEYDSELLLGGKYYRKGETEPASKVINREGVATLFDASGRCLNRITYSNGKPRP